MRWLLQYGAHFRAPLPQVVRTAGFVTIQWGTGDALSTVAHLSRSQNAAMLAALKGSSDFHSQGPAGKPDFSLVFENVPGKATEAMWRYDYFAASGEFGRDHEWCVAPAAFQTWMRTLGTRR